MFTNTSSAKTKSTFSALDKAQQILNSKSSTNTAYNNASVHRSTSGSKRVVQSQGIPYVGSPTSYSLANRANTAFPDFPSSQALSPPSKQPSKKQVSSSSESEDINAYLQKMSTKTKSVQKDAAPIQASKKKTHRPVPRPANEEAFTTPQADSTPVESSYLKQKPQIKVAEGGDAAPRTRTLSAAEYLKRKGMGLQPMLRSEDAPGEILKKATSNKKPPLKETNQQKPNVENEKNSSTSKTEDTSSIGSDFNAFLNSGKSKKKVPLARPSAVAEREIPVAPSLLAKAQEAMAFMNTKPTFESGTLQKSKEGDIPPSSDTGILRKDLEMVLESVPSSKATTPGFKASGDISQAPVPIQDEDLPPPVLERQSPKDEPVNGVSQPLTAPQVQPAISSALQPNIASESEIEVASEAIEALTVEEIEEKVEPQRSSVVSLISYSSSFIDEISGEALEVTKEVVSTSKGEKTPEQKLPLEKEEIVQVEEIEEKEEMTRPASLNHLEPEVSGHQVEKLVVKSFCAVEGPRTDLSPLQSSPPEKASLEKFPIRQSKQVIAETQEKPRLEYKPVQLEAAECRQKGFSEYNSQSFEDFEASSIPKSSSQPSLPINGEESHSPQKVAQQREMQKPDILTPEKVKSKRKRYKHQATQTNSNADTPRPCSQCERHRHRRHHPHHHHRHRFHGGPTSSRSQGILYSPPPFPFTTPLPAFYPAKGMGAHCHCHCQCHQSFQPQPNLPSAISRTNLAAACSTSSPQIPPSPSHPVSNSIPASLAGNSSFLSQENPIVTALNQLMQSQLNMLEKLITSSRRYVEDEEAFALASAYGMASRNSLYPPSGPTPPLPSTTQTPSFERAMHERLSK